MIGVQFALRCVQFGISVAVVVGVIFVVFFGITWIVRMVIDGSGIIMGDHWIWLKSKMPKRKRKRKVKIDTVSMTAEEYARLKDIEKRMNEENPK